MQLFKEAIKGNPQALTQLFDSLQQDVTYAKWPGELEVGGTVYDMLLSFLHEACSIDYPAINNGLKIFNRIPVARKAFDTLSSIQLQWILNNIDIESGSSAVNAVDLLLATPKTFAITLPIVLRFNSLNYTIIEYKGDIRIGGNYRKDKSNFGMSMKINMTKNYASGDGFYATLGGTRASRFSDLDLNSYVREYKKVQHTPFKSLFKFGKDQPQFRAQSTSLKPTLLSSIALLVSNGKLIGNNAGFKGDLKKSENWFRDNVSYTKVELEGLVVYDGKMDTCPNRSSLLSIIKDEVDSIPAGDSFLSAEYDIQVFLYDSNDNLCYKQLGVVGFKKIKNDYCATILDEKELKQVFKPAFIDLNRLERDTELIDKTRLLFEDDIYRHVSVPFKDKSWFNNTVKAFIASTADILLKNKKLSSGFKVVCYLDTDIKNVLAMKDLNESPSWQSFLDEVSDYDFSLDTTEEYVFDLLLKVLHIDSNATEEVIRYRGTLSVEMESESKVNLEIRLKADKQHYANNRVKGINRFSDLEYK